MVGEQIGLDEGAIFEALSDSIWTETVVKYRHNKDGLVTSQTTTTKNVTGSMVLMVLLAGAAGLVAKGVLDELPIVPEASKSAWFEWFKTLMGAGWL